MGNSRLGLLDMILNAWLFKLNHTKRDSRAKPKESLQPNTTPNQSFTPNRASYYYPTTATSTEKHTNSPSHLKVSGTQFSNPPRKLVTSSISNLCIQADDLQQANITTTATADKTNKVSCRTSLELKDFVVVSDLKLPPILIGKGRYSNNPTERSPAGFHRLRMRVSSTPRFTVKRVQVQKGRRSSGSPRARKRFSESFAIVKSSYDPEKDFRESMMEMIVEKNIRAAKDLEELLAWYLMLNSNEYHDVIVKVFRQIWFDLSDFIKL